MVQEFRELCKDIPLVLPRGGTGAVLLALGHFHQTLEGLSRSGLLIAKHSQPNSGKDKTKRAARQRPWDPLVGGFCSGGFR